MPIEDFGTWLTNALRRREMTESDLARRIGRPPSMVNRWAHGQRLPSTASCDLIADALAIDLDTVLAKAGHRPVTERIDPDDPRAILIDLIKRVEMAPDRFGFLEGALRSMLKVDQAARAKH